MSFVNPIEVGTDKGVLSFWSQIISMASTQKNDPFNQTKVLRMSRWHIWEARRLQCYWCLQNTEQEEYKRRSNSFEANLL